MPPTSQPLTHGGYLRSTSLGGRDTSSSLSSGRPKGTKEESGVCHRGTSSPLPDAHAWRIDRNRRGEFPMRGGSYLIHSPRVLPTPRGDYFTADQSVQGGRGRARGSTGFEGDRTRWLQGRDDDTRSVLRKSMSRPTSRSKQIVSATACRCRGLPRGAYDSWLFFSTVRRVTCHGAMTTSEANEITILYSVHQFSKTGYPNFRLTHALKMLLFQWRVKKSNPCFITFVKIS